MISEADIIRLGAFAPDVRSKISNDKKQLFINAFKTFFPKLQQPVTEFQFHPTRKWRFDVCWPDRKIACEIEGGVWNSRTGHSSGSGISRDIEKGNEAVLCGWRLLRFTTTMLRQDAFGCCEKVAGLLKR